MWSTAIENIDDAAVDDYDAEANVVLEAIQLNMLSTTEEANMGFVASGAKWFASHLYGKVPRGPFNFAISKKTEVEEGVEGKILQLLKPEGGVIVTAAGKRSFTLSHRFWAVEIPRDYQGPRVF